VREYQLVMCYPFFPVGALSEARLYRLHVLEVLDAMGRWDDHEREVAIAIFKGRNVVKDDGVPREDAERILNEALKALPHYLSAAEIPRTRGTARLREVQPQARDRGARALPEPARAPAVQEHRDVHRRGRWPRRQPEKPLMIPGRKIMIGETEYLVPPANWNTQKLHKPFLDAMAKAKVGAAALPAEMTPHDALDAMLDIGFRALKRNYPDVKLEELGEHIDQPKIAELFAAAMNAPAELAAGKV
jgi:hypothetical protein